MSRPQKIIPPIKGSFTQIIDAIASGKGVKSHKKSHAVKAGHFASKTSKKK